MFAFMRRHWAAYLIGAALAVAMGFGVSHFLGEKWSTPADVRAERVAAEKSNKKAADQLADMSDGELSSSDPSDSADAPSE